MPSHTVPVSPGCPRHPGLGFHGASHSCPPTAVPLHCRGDLPVSEHRAPALTLSLVSHQRTSRICRDTNEAVASEPLTRVAPSGARGRTLAMCSHADLLLVKFAKGRSFICHCLFPHQVPLLLEVFAVVEAVMESIYSHFC